MGRNWLQKYCRAVAYLLVTLLLLNSIGPTVDVIAASNESTEYREAQETVASEEELTEISTEEVEHDQEGKEVAQSDLVEEPQSTPVSSSGQDVLVDTAEKLEEYIAGITSDSGEHTITIAKNITLTKPLIINLSDVTIIIKGQNYIITSPEKERHMEISSNRVKLVLDGVILDGDNKGGGIYSYSQGLEIDGRDNSIIQNCFAHIGAGLNLGGFFTLKNMQIYNNNATGMAAGLVFTHKTLSGELSSIEHCRINNNKTDGTGAGLVLLMDRTSPIKIIDSEINNNEATIAGSGIHVSGDDDPYQASLEIMGCEISNNTGPVGIAVAGTLKVSISDTEINNNSGVGLNANPGCDIEINESTFNNNYAGINVTDGFNISINGSEINKNSAWGLAVREYDICEVKNTDITYNGSGIGSSMGSGVRFLAVDKELKLTNCKVSFNTAKSSGGGVYCLGNAVIAECEIMENTARDNGGGIFVESANDLQIINSKISSNEACNGGGIIFKKPDTGIYSGSINGKLTLSGSTELKNNKADESGGAIWAGMDLLQNVSIKETVVFSGNEAEAYYDAIRPGFEGYHSENIKTNKFTKNPLTNLPFLHGYSNYDIGYMPLKYKVTYNANLRNNNSLFVHQAIQDTSYRILKNSEERGLGFKRDGYDFLGWSTIVNATTPQYQGGEEITVLGNTELFAIWKKSGTTDPGTGGPGGNGGGGGAGGGGAGGGGGAAGGGGTSSGSTEAPSTGGTTDPSTPSKKAGWVKVGKYQYYYRKGVKVTSSWISETNGDKYYLDKDGKMVTSKWITTKGGNKYYVGSNGKMVTSKWITTKAGFKYYLGADGKMARSKWITTKAGNQYYVNANGRMVKKR